MPYYQNACIEDRWVVYVLETATRIKLAQSRQQYSVMRYQFREHLLL